MMFSFCRQRQAQAQDEDLNRASEEKEMNVLFEHTVIAPGDATYEYDKRIEFEADEESSWDWVICYGRTERLSVR